MRTACIVMVVLAAAATARAADECKPFSHDGDRPDLYLNEAISKMSGCSDYSSAARDRQDAIGAYWLDRVDHPVSEIARVYHVWTCYAGEARTTALTCAVDARRLNRAAFAAEVGKLPLSAQRKANFERYFDEAEQRVKKADSTIAWAYGVQPQSKQVLDAAEKGFTSDWDAFYRSHKAVIDAAWSVEDKWWNTDPGKRLTGTVDLGCDVLRQGWQHWVNDKKIARAKEIPDLVGHDEIAVITLRALALCDAAGGRQADAVAEAEALKRSFPFHGPRMHAVWVAMEATSKLIPETVGPVFTPARLNDELLKQATERAAYNYNADESDQLEQGVIDKITKVADGYKLTFKKQQWMEPDMDCQPSGRPWWSTVDGRWKHDYTCKQVGSHRESSQLEPRIVSAQTGDGLKPGQVVTLRTGQYPGRDGSYAFVIESRTPQRGAKMTRRKVSTQRGADLSVAGTLNVVYGVALR